MSTAIQLDAQGGAGDLNLILDGRVAFCAFLRPLRSHERANTPDGVEVWAIHDIARGGLPLLMERSSSFTVHQLMADIGRDPDLFQRLLTASPYRTIAGRPYGWRSIEA
jgi:hypothetical protein